MGSRDSQTTVYWVKENIQVVCGCFRGNLIEFKNRVIERHGESEHAVSYLKFIKIVKSIIDMNI
jgi:hypothetical protein